MTYEERLWWRKYHRYLNSRDWARTREAALVRDRRRCRRCGNGARRGNPLQANHLSYRAYNATGHTPLSDLETLCRSCHQRITGHSFRRDYGAATWRESFVGLMKLAAIAAVALFILEHC